MQGNKFIIQAHRGACSLYMENSMPAFEEALRIGVHGIELDVQLTQDGHLIVVHDDILPPEATGKATDLCVQNLSLKEVRELSISYPRRLKFKRPLTEGERQVVTLAEVITRVAVLRQPSFLWLDIELKVPKVFEANPSFRSRYLNAFRKTIAHAPISLAIRSFDWELLREFRKLEPKFRVGILSEPGVIPDKSTLDTIAPYFWAPCLKDLNEESVKELQARRVIVIPWTVNDREGFQKCREMGCDGLTSDDPETMFKFLATP